MSSTFAKFVKNRKRAIIIPLSIRHLLYEFLANINETENTIKMEARRDEQTKKKHFLFVVKNCNPARKKTNILALVRSLP